MNKLARHVYIYIHLYIHILYIHIRCTNFQQIKNLAWASQPWPAALAYLALENHLNFGAEKKSYPEVLLEEHPEDSNLQNQQTDKTSVSHMFIVRITLLSWWAIQPAAQPFTSPQTKPPPSICLAGTASLRDIPFNTVHLQSYECK